MEDHLDRCEPCSRLLVEIAGRASLASHAGRQAGQAFGPTTLAILGRVIANSPERPGRPPDLGEPPVPPDIPGLVDWEVVGRGGMGVVYRAREVALDRPVAVKVLSSPGRIAPSARARAGREAMLMASLRHPNVVPVYRSGESDGQPFLVMEWIGGGTLQGRIESGASSPREAAETARALALAVAEAHALGIIHRDLKPDNVLLAPSGGPGSKPIPKLTDFGLARRGVADGMTEAGMILGTPGYMAPEQTGLDRLLGEVGPATDIHGLGAILFACLIGRAPYAGGTSWESLVRAARGAPTSVRDLRRDVPRDLATIVEKCLQASPSRRYRSAGELADDLGRFLEGRPISARPVSPAERWLKWARRHPALAASASLLVAASVGGVVGTAYHVASLRAEQVKTNAALASATSARDRAKSALGSLTDDAVQRMVQRGQALDEGDRAFLRKVRGYFQEWPLEPDPGEALNFRGSGLARLGDIFEQADQYDDARICREAAINSFGELIRRGLGGPGAIQARRMTMGRLCDGLIKSGQYRDAEALLRRSIEMHEPLARTDKAYRSPLAVDYADLGYVLRLQGRHREADEASREGIGRLEKLRLEAPRDMTTLESEMNAYYNTAILVEDRDRSESLYRSLVARSEAALAVFPDDSEFIRFQILGLVGIISAIRENRPEEALLLHRRRIDLARKLVVKEPENQVFRGDIVHGAAQTYGLCARLRRPREAEVELERAVEEGAQMVAAEPAVYDWARALTEALQAHARLFEATGRPREAIAQLDRMVATLDPWKKLQGRSAEVVPQLAWAHRQSAALVSKLGDHAEAARRLGLILELCGPEDVGRLQREIAEELRATGDRPGSPEAAEEAEQSRRALADPPKE